MNVELKGVLKEDTGRDRVILFIKGTVTLAELKKKLGIDPGIPVVACIGEKQLKSDYLFNDSDNPTLLPVVAGG